MRINVSQLLKEETGASRDHRVAEEIDGIDEKLELRAPLEGEVRLTRTDRGILVQATLSTDWELACGRCLDTFEQPVSIQIEEEYEATIDLRTGARRKAASEFTIDARHTLDLSDGIRQALLLEVPISPTCREACAGLCPECGLNLNDHPSHRHSKSIDPRLTVLQDLLSGSR